LQIRNGGGGEVSIDIEQTSSENIKGEGAIGGALKEMPSTKCKT